MTTAAVARLTSASAPAGAVARCRGRRRQRSRPLYVRPVGPRQLRLLRHVGVVPPRRHARQRSQDLVTRCGGGADPGRLDHRARHLDGERRRGQCRRCGAHVQRGGRGEGRSLSLLPRRSGQPHVPRQRVGRAGTAHRDLRGDRERTLRLHREEPARSRAPDLRRDRPRRHQPGDDRADPGRLRHPRHLRPRRTGVRLRLEHRRDHLRRGERHSGWLGLGAGRGRAARPPRAGPPTTAGGSTIR